jgi:ribA/ribD-fused uncharacterized protein
MISAYIWEYKLFNPAGKERKMIRITTARVGEISRLEKRKDLFTVIDVTVKNAKGARTSLAPTWNMVMGYKKGVLSEKDYTKQYTEILKQSQKRFPNKWEATLRKNENKTIVFCCFCPKGNFCHRHLLAKEFINFAEQIGIKAVLIEEEDSSPIKSFRGDYFFLSNFYSIEIEYERIKYPSTEHAFHAAKTLIPSEKEKIRKASTPKKAKKLGKRVTLRPDWAKVKEEVMLEINEYKYKKNPFLARKLLNTGSKPLIEENSWNDTYWGTCRGKGQNKLGKILMKIRTSILNPAEKR